MSNAKIIIGYFLHVFLFIILSFSKCNSSNNSQLDRNLHRTSKTSNMNSENNHESVHEIVRTPQNNSLNENELKDSAPVWPNKMNSTTVMEGFTVFAGLSIVIVLYFIIKAIRLRKRRCRVRKYGLLTSRDDVEMTPLGEEEEDDEDSTVFDINDHSRPSSMTRP